MNRGTPMYNDVTHYQHPEYLKVEPICRNGSYHLKITTNRKKVTCEICKLKIK